MGTWGNPKDASDRKLKGGVESYICWKGRRLQEPPCRAPALVPEDQDAPRCNRLGQLQHSRDATKLLIQGGAYLPRGRSLGEANETMSRRIAKQMAPHVLIIYIYIYVQRRGGGYRCGLLVRLL